jgi:tRNA (guanine-N7-)-methyltransferase
MDWATYYPAYAKPKVNKSNAPTTSQVEDNGIEVVQAQDGSNTNGGSDLATKLIGMKDMRQLTQDVEVADIGCGFGGLLVALAPKLPDTLLLGELP